MTAGVNISLAVVQVPITPGLYVPNPLSELSPIENLNPSTPPFAPPVEPASGIKYVNVIKYGLPTVRLISLRECKPTPATTVIL